MTNSVTGLVNSYGDYRHIQKDNSSIINEAGKIDYRLNLGSGTGIGQTNKIWYKNKNLITTDTINLLNTEYTRFGLNTTDPMMGAGSANVKAIHVENSSSYNIGIKLPFDRFNSEFYIVPPSGNVVLSNIRGWSISPTGSIIQISGNGTSQNYSVSIIGAELPIFIDNAIGIPIEYKSSSVFDKTVNIEFANTAISSAGLIPFEYLKTPSGSSISQIPIEYLATPSSNGMFNWENKNIVEFGKNIPIEWKSSGVGGEASGELLRNTKFLYAGTGTDFDYWDGIIDPSSVPPWDFIWPTGTLVQNKYLAMQEEECRFFFAIWRFGPSGGGYVRNILLLGSPWSSFQRFEYRARQQVYNVVSGVTYRISWMHEVDSPESYRPNFVDKPQYNLYAKNGTLLSSTHFSNTLGSVPFSTNVTAIDTEFRLEWIMPQLPYYAADPITWRDEIRDIPLSSWFIETPSIKRV